MTTRATALEDLRLVHVIPTTRMGGLEQVATQLALGLARRSAQLVVCTSGGPPFEDALRGSPGIRVELIPRPRPHPIALLRSARGLASILRRERPDVVHAHNPAAGAVAALACRLARARQTAIVTTYHGVPPGRLGRATRALSSTSDVVVGVGPTVTRELGAKGLPASKSATIMNAVEVRPARAAGAVRHELEADGRALVVSVGRYRPQKNQALLLEAIAIVVANGHRLRVALVGGGALETDLRNRVSALELDDVVVLTGEREDAIDIAAAADVFALTSHWEGLPLALLEAMALGRPVVATAVTGVTDLVRHEETGLLVEPGDSAALAEAIERLLGDKDLGRRLGGSARALVEAEFSVPAMVDAYATLYADVAARRRR